METATRTTDRRAAATTAEGDFILTDQAFGDSRQRLISYLVKLNRALDDNLPDLSQALLSRFCDALVDYLSEGHFRVFQRLSLPARSYALIAATTRAGMAFNDRYGLLTEIRVVEVKGALEQVARVLCARFELEDDLLYGKPC